ncbi:MAG TPA: hypothetical protein D7I16_02850 [Candidatus Poseidoniales archaeon]|nr:MAG TPA: hypothetical protein D7I16_02850 [Candidatus Poseidoniales archaeon]
MKTSSSTMAVDGLLAVGGILSLALGVSGLILVKTQKLEVIWNKRFAAQLLCWIFICKGVANSLRSIGYDTEFWRIVLYGGHFNDQIFGGLILLIALIFPVPILRTRKQFNIGVAVILAYCLLMMGAAVFMKINTPLAAFTGLYLIPGFIWTLVYLKFRFMKGQEDNEEIQGVADVAVLLLVLMIGHILFRWVGMFAGSDYFYFMDLYGGNFANDYLWSQGLASAVIFGLVILCGEIYQASQGRVRTTSYVVFTYMAIGVLSHIVFRNVELFGSGGGTLTGTELEGLSSWQQIWTEITTTLHFTMMRPILGLYILFRYGLIRISEDNEQVGKATAIVLIVVATSALLEIVQSLIPLTEMLSAGILGIAIAFGIGWEERSFQSLISNPLRFPLRTKGAYFPEVTFDKSEYYRLDKALTAILIFFGFVAFILHWSQVEPF